MICNALIGTVRVARCVPLLERQSTKQARMVCFIKKDAHPTNPRIIPYSALVAMDLRLIFFS